ncbi:MAG: hypothetical protein C0506_11545 [Anaerolinea sp.]|nr:hypothetical protein [Anaerolinea sp.]
MNTQKQIVVMVVLMFIFVGGCAAYSVIELPYRAPLQKEWTKDQSVERGALLFANNCRTCHGIKGEGGVGPQLNRPDFQNQDPLVLKANRALLKTTLSCGRAGTVMPAWLNTNGGALNAIQIEHLIDLITEPAEADVLDDAGNPTSKGWVEAVEFARNLNRHTTVVIGGDTLDTIAKAHGIGSRQLAELNGLPVSGVLKQGSKLKIPGFGADPDGYTYAVYNDNETIAKVADGQHVGALMIADLNNIPYKFSQSKGRATLQILNDAGVVVPGLYPGDKLALPEGATYTVVAGDTLESVAERHGLTPAEIKGLNAALLQGVDNTAALEYTRRLKLPAGAAAVVQEGQTLALIAAQHDLKPEDFAAANGLGEDAVLQAGERLSLPPGTRYVIQSGDTLESVALAHGLSADILASENGLDPGDPLDPAVVLALPKISAYVVKGESLADAAKTLSNVTAESLAAASKIAPEDVVPIGQTLQMPADAWGSAPPDTKNPGTACVQHAVPNSVFQTLPGVGSATPAAAVTPPATESKEVTIDANANDFTLTADGTKQPANKGVVLIAKGTAVKFAGVVGLHTITLNGKKDGDDIRPGQTRSITFSTAGTFKITCDYHPDMLATIFVQ